MSEAEAIARALKAKRNRKGWTAFCPAHDDGRHSLSIADVRGKVLLKCFAGCTFEEITDALRARGLWSPNGRHERAEKWPPKAKQSDYDDEFIKLRISDAAKKWKGTVSAIGSPVVTYLRSRGITIGPTPPSLRYARWRHPQGGYFPVMVGNVVDVNGNTTGLHRTYLKESGDGKAAVEPAKLMLGICAGGAVRLGDAVDHVGVAEGIESGLSAQQLFGVPVWAALSTSGLRALVLPGSIKRVTVFADRDVPGVAAANEAARHWRAQGRHVDVKLPKAADFNEDARHG